MSVIDFEVVVTVSAAVAADCPDLVIIALSVADAQVRVTKTPSGDDVHAHH